MPQIIQFLHPGVEAVPASPLQNYIGWNVAPKHKRKFLISEGKYLDHNGEIKNDTLSFWGQWEPPSDIEPTNSTRLYYPHYFNYPFLTSPTNSVCHTTDPYVFGNKFRYFVCRQEANSHILKNLVSGSILLFGSSINDRFCLDTVFVVSKNKKVYTKNTMKDVFEDKMKSQFGLAALQPIYNSFCVTENNSDFIYYEGVTYDERNEYGGLYSYVPCKIYNPAGRQKSLFHRPILNFDWITGGQVMGIHSHSLNSDELSNQWNELNIILEAQELYKGFFFNSPKMRN